MQQQINLYQPIFRKQRKIFSAVTLTQITLICLVGLLLIGGFMQFRLHRLRTSEQALAAQYNHLKAIVDARGSDQDDPTLKTLDEHIASLESMLHDKQTILEKMGALANKNGRAGFAPYLAALSSKRLTGLWLTGIQLSEGGREAQLSGVALQADLIPQYLQLLLEVSPSKTMTFKQVVVTRTPDSPQHLAFTLQTKAAPPSGQQL